MAASDVCDLIPPVPGLVEQFKPRLKYLLIDENAYTDSELASLKNLAAAVFRIEHPASPAAIGVLLSLLNEWLVDRCYVLPWPRSCLLYTSRCV